MLIAVSRDTWLLCAGVDCERIDAPTRFATTRRWCRIQFIHKSFIWATTLNAQPRVATSSVASRQAGRHGRMDNRRRIRTCTNKQTNKHEHSMTTNRKCRWTLRHQCSSAIHCSGMSRMECCALCWWNCFGPFEHDQPRLFVDKGGRCILIPLDHRRRHTIRHLARFIFVCLFFDTGGNSVGANKERHRMVEEWMNGSGEQQSLLLQAIFASLLNSLNVIGHIVWKHSVNQSEFVCF